MTAYPAVTLRRSTSWYGKVRKSEKLIHTVRLSKGHRCTGLSLEQRTPGRFGSEEAHGSSISRQSPFVFLSSSIGKTKRVPKLLNPVRRPYLVCSGCRGR